MSSEYFEIDMFQAGKGDCFLVRCGDNSYKTTILIDSGVAGTETKILDRLDALGITKIDLFVITHIDDDHIGGASGFLEQIEKRENNKIQIGEIWHNSCVHLKLPADNNADLNLVKLNEKMAKIKDDVQDYLESIRPVHAGHGSNFSETIRKLGYEKVWNTLANKKAISIDYMESEILFNNVKIRLLSPDNKQLQDLANFWNKLAKEKFNIEDNLGYSIFKDDSDYLLFLKEYDKEKKALKIEPSNAHIEDLSFEELIEEENLKKKNFGNDSSPTNGSSISFIIEFKGKLALFLADSHNKRIIDSLNTCPDGRINFEYIKLSHHGSIKNLSYEFLRKVDTTRFVISTKGKKHPDQETIAVIINNNENVPIEKTIISNYNSINIARMKNDFDKKNNIIFKVNSLDEPFTTEAII